MLDGDFVAARVGDLEHPARARRGHEGLLEGFEVDLEVPGRHLAGEGGGVEGRDQAVELEAGGVGLVEEHAEGPELEAPLVEEGVVFVEQLQAQALDVELLRRAGDVAEGPGLAAELDLGAQALALADQAGVVLEGVDVGR